MKYQLFITKEKAGSDLEPNSYVGIGYPRMHNVYRVNQNGDLNFLYHYDANRTEQITNWSFLSK